MTPPLDASFRFGELVLIRWYAQPPPRAQQVPSLFAIVELRRLASSDRPHGLLDFAETLGHGHQTVTSQIASNERIASALALMERELEVGSLLAFRRPAPAIRIPDAMLASRSMEASLLQPSPVVQESQSEKTWIEICLLGEDGSPVRGETCRLRLPDGREISGRTDASGVLRIDDLPPGSCEVSFDALDESAWDPAPTAS